MNTFEWHFQMLQIFCNLIFFSSFYFRWFGSHLYWQYKIVLKRQHNHAHFSTKFKIVCTWSLTICFRVKTWIYVILKCTNARKLLSETMKIKTCSVTTLSFKFDDLEEKVFLLKIFTELLSHFLNWFKNHFSFGFVLLIFVFFSEYWNVLSNVVSCPFIFCYHYCEKKIQNTKKKFNSGMSKVRRQNAKVFKSFQWKLVIWQYLLATKWECKILHDRGMIRTIIILSREKQINLAQFPRVRMGFYCFSSILLLVTLTFPSTVSCTNTCKSCVARQLYDKNIFVFVLFIYFIFLFLHLLEKWSS